MQSKIFAFVLAACTIVLVGASVYAQSQAAPATAADVSEVEYHNQQFNFSLQYPAGMTVSEDSGDGGSETIFFVDATSGKQFEIEAIPYAKVNLAGNAPAPDTSATASDQGSTLANVNVVVDDTVQVWFTKNGVMYEVIAFKDDEPWLLSLLQTWRFN